MYNGSTDGAIRRYINPDSILKTAFPISPPPATENPPAFGTDMAIENVEGHAFNGFAVGKPWQIRVLFTVTRRVEHFIVALGLVNDRGVPIWTVWSTPSDMEPGYYQALFRNEKVFLCSGFFPIVLGLSSHVRTFQSVEDAGILVVSEVSVASEVIKANGECGFITDPMSITITDLAYQSNQKIAAEAT